MKDSTALDQLILRYPSLAVCRDDIFDAALALCATFCHYNKLLICGNGGSWADAHHIAGELLKSFTRKRPITEEWADALPDEIRGKLEGGLPAIVLGSAGAFASAFANDVDPDLIYAQEAQVMGGVGDTLFCISTSGNAKNVVLAAQVAKAKGLAVIGLTGRDGGCLKPLCDICICVPEDETYRIQELHLPVYHTLCILVENAMFARTVSNGE